MRIAIIGTAICVLALPFLVACSGQEATMIVPTSTPAVVAAMARSGTTSPTATATRAASSSATRSATRTPTLDGPRYPLTPGQSVTVPNNDLTVRFREVINDSRCPDSPNLLCTTAGEATVAFEATTRNEVEAFTLAMPGLTRDTTVAPAYPNSRIELKRYVVQLVSLEPQPRVSDDPRGPASDPRTATILIAPATNVGQLGGSYALGIGEMVRFTEQSMTIRFVAVSRDGRCSVSLVACRQTTNAGEAIVALEISKGGMSETFGLALPGRTDIAAPTPDPARARREILGYTVQIVSLVPYLGSCCDTASLTPSPTPTPRPIYATIRVTALP